MSTRERWIVYPLLFLTLGIAMRDKVLPPTHFQAGEIAAEQIRCNQLQAGQAVCAGLLVAGSNGRPIVVAGTDAATKNGLIEIFSAADGPLVRLQSTNAGGVVTLPELGLTIPLARPWRHGIESGAPPPQKTKTLPTPSPKQPSPLTGGDIR